MIVFIVKKGIIARNHAYEKLRESLSMDSYHLLKEHHKGWVKDYRGANNTYYWDINDVYSII